MIQEVPCFQESFRVMYHHIGMELPSPISGPLGTYMAMLGWCPSMQPWSQLPLMPYLIICHLCMVAFLHTGKFNFVECCLQCTGSDQCPRMKNSGWFIRSFKIWHWIILQWIYADGRCGTSTGANWRTTSK